MKLPPLKRARILRRYKRFLADVEHEGEELTVHCANTGAMTSCWEPGAEVEISFSDNPKRKLPWSLERVDMGAGWVGVNTSRVNTIVAEGIQHQRIRELSGFRSLQREPVFATETHGKSRFDFLLTDHISDQRQAYVEVKNATLLLDNKIQFPDAVSIRAKKHLELLSLAAKQGFESWLVFAINRPETMVFQAAVSIDQDYASTLSTAINEWGVKVLLVRLSHTKDAIEVTTSERWFG